MAYRIAADITILLHFAWILFLTMGFPVVLAVNRAGWRIFHFIALVVTVLMQVTGTICPLTYCEAYLRSQGRETDLYPGAFMIEWIEHIIYVGDATLPAITLCTIGFLAVVVSSFWFRPPRMHSRDR